MADRVDQSEQHYSAGSPPPPPQDYFSTARHFAELVTSVCGDWVTFDAQENRNEGLQSPPHEFIMALLWSDTLLPISAAIKTTTYQAVELGNWAFAARLADVPDLDTTLAASVDVTCRIADGDSTHHFPMAQCVDLASVARDARAYQCVWGEGHGLHLSIRTHVKRIGTAEE